MKNQQLADLSHDQHQAINQLEAELGVVLIAYENYRQMTTAANRSTNSNVCHTNGEGTWPSPFCLAYMSNC